jgi:hypothetical protein
MDKAAYIISQEEKQEEEGTRVPQSPWGDIVPIT